MTEIAAAAARTLRAGSARIRRDVFIEDLAEPVMVYEGLADLAGRRVRLDPAGGGLARVYADGALRHEANDGTWAIFDRRPGRGDPLAILDWLAAGGTSYVLAAEAQDVRGVPCERVEFRTDGDPLVMGRGWVGPDDRLRRLDWRVPSGTRVRIELWDFGVPAAIEVPDAERIRPWALRLRLLRIVVRGRLRGR